MMWGFLDDSIYVTRYFRVGGYKRMNARGKGFRVLRFCVPNCKFEGVEVHKASLIASRVHQYVPTLGQPGLLHLLTTEMG